MKRVVLWLAALLGLIVLVVLMFFGYAYFRYHDVPQVARPCQGCTSSVTVNGFELYYRELGADNPGVPIVVIHGGPGHSSDSFGQSLDFLARTHRVILFDQRGSGHSQLIPGADYSAQAIVDDIDTIRTQVLDVPEIDLLAHSAGGAIAQMYALQHPDAVSKLVLVASTPVNNNLSPAWVWKVFGPGLYATDLGLPPANDTDAWFEAKLAPDEVARLYDPADARLLANSGPSTFTTWFEVSQSLAGPDRAEELRALQVPTLVVYGQADDQYTGQPAAQTICGELPDCQLVGIPESGHWPFKENPPAFQQAVSEFLD